MIHDLIQGFDPDHFRRFLRTKFPSFVESSRSLSDLAPATATATPAKPTISVHSKTACVKLNNK